MKKNKYCKKAFTLAEILIASALVGTVAALSISTLFYNNQTMNNSYVAGFKKTYNELYYATEKIKAENGGTLVGAFTDTDNMINKYCKYLKCSKICNTTPASSGCWTSSPKLLHGGNIWYNPNDATYRGIVLADGTTIITFLDSTACTNPSPDRPDNCAWFHIDVNGTKSPNLQGRDIFAMINTKNGLYVDGSIGTYADYNTYCNQASNNVLNGIGCTGRVLKEGKMMY